MFNPKAKTRILASYPLLLLFLISSSSMGGNTKVAADARTKGVDCVEGICRGGGEVDRMGTGLEEEMLRRRMGSKSPYTFSGLEDTRFYGAPRSCSEIMMVGLLRHGSRNPGKSDSRYVAKGRRSDSW